MILETVPISSLIPDPANVRKHSPKNLDAIKGSLARFGQQKPIVVGVDNVVIAGNGTLDAAKALGWSEIAITRTTLTGMDLVAYGIADNRSGELAEWDQEALAKALTGLEAEGLELAELGFDVGDLEEMLPEKPDGDADAEPQIDNAEELREKWGVEPGQLWQLGDHRLLCGDSTKAEDVERVLAGDKPLLMVTDPPYGVEYDADWRNHALRAVGKVIAGRAVGKVMNDDRADWRDAWALFPGDVAYVWHAGNKANVVADSLIVCDFQIRAQIIWAKSNHVISRGHYHPKHEPCWYAVRKGGTGHWNGDRSQTTLWEIPKPAKSETGHSTQKPIECMARPIRNHDSEFVYEPFSGSGTTTIACEQLGRKCRAIEISPGYVAVAIQRWADATGKTPKPIK